MKKGILLLLLLGAVGVAPLAWGQYAASASGSANAAAEINSKPAIQSGAGNASGNCTTGKDLWLNTSNFSVFACTAANVWTLINPTQIVLPTGLADYGIAVNSAMAALPAACGSVILPFGVLPIATTISITKNSCTIEGQGDASLNAIAATTLNWTGGASPVITSTSNRDLILYNFNIDNHGTGTIGVNLVSDASDLFNILVDHVSIVDPNTLFTDSGFKVSSTGAHPSTQLTFRKCYVALAAATGLYVDHANAINVDDSTFNDNTNYNVNVGPTNIVVSFSMHSQSDTEYLAGGGESATAIGINIGFVWRATISDSYAENINAGELAINIGASARSVEISGFFGNGHTTCTNAVNITAGALAISIHDNFFASYAGAWLVNGAAAGQVTTYNNYTAGGTDVTGGQGFPSLQVFGQLTLPVAIGTAPLVVTSTTPVTNLTLASGTQLPPTAFPTPGVTVSLAAPRSYYECTGACNVTLPTPANGYEFCVRNADNVSTAITLVNIAAVTFESTAKTSYYTANHKLVSTGAVTDQICLVGNGTTKYDVFSSNGTWTDTP